MEGMTMKRLTVFLFIILSMASCADSLSLDSTTELEEKKFWKTIDDAEYALNGVYASARLVFDRDYYWDGHGDYLRAKTGAMSITSGYSSGYVG